MVSVNSAAPVANSAAQQSCQLSNFYSSACDKVSCFVRAVLSTFAELPAQWRSAGFFSGTAAWTAANPLAAAVIVITAVAMVAFGVHRCCRRAAPAPSNDGSNTTNLAASTADQPATSTADQPATSTPAQPAAATPAQPAADQPATSTPAQPAANTSVQPAADTPAQANA